MNMEFGAGIPVFAVLILMWGSACIGYDVGIKVIDAKHCEVQK